MENEDVKIGFIGLGIMGKPMVRNLLKAGYKPLVFNRSRAAVDELLEEGALAGESAKDVAGRCDIVITMLPDTPYVEAVVSGEGGIMEGAREGLLIVDMSTISPVVTRRLAAEAAEKGVKMIDAPVSGGDKGAIAGTLSIMAGGDAEDFERVKPVFEAMGKTIVHCGPVGAGQTVKACNQIVVAVVIEAISEALVLGSKAGVDPKVVLEVLSGGLAQTKVMDMRGPTMIEHNFAPGFKAKLHLKDLNIILETAEEYGVGLPVTKIVSGMFKELTEKDRGDLDHSSLLLVIEELSDHSIVKSRASDA
ncbi:MAG: 2-hydroxy-3-oxopropionate reductase [Pyrinomonadaceae bacterium]